MCFFKGTLHWIQGGNGDTAVTFFQLVFLYYLQKQPPQLSAPPREEGKGSAAQVAAAKPLQISARLPR